MTKIIPFPTTHEMVKMGVGFVSDWNSKFSFPDGYVQELKTRFPGVRHLHNALKQDDQGMVNALLSAHLTKLSVITPEQVVKAKAKRKLDELVDRANQAVEFKKFLGNLERRYFPERIKARKEFNLGVTQDYL